MKYLFYYDAEIDDYMGKKSLPLFSYNKEALKRFIFASYVEHYENSENSNRFQYVHDTIFTSKDVLSIKYCQPYEYNLVFDDKVTEGKLDKNSIYLLNDKCELKNFGNKDSLYYYFIRKYDIRSFRYQSFDMVYCPKYDGYHYLYSNSQEALKKYIFTNTIQSYNKTTYSYDAQKIHDNIFIHNNVVEKISELPLMANVGDNKVDNNDVFFLLFGGSFNKCKDYTAQYEEFIKKFNIKTE